MQRLCFAALALSSASGCASLKQLTEATFAQPSIHFKAASLENVSLGSATVNLVYSVENPNPVGLSLAEVKYSFSIEGKQIVAGAPPQGLHLPAKGAAELEFPASVNFADLASALEVFLKKDFAAYRAEGEVGIATPVGLVRLPLSKQGEFEVPKLPRLEFGSLRVAGVTPVGATLEVPMTVSNRNSYSLLVRSFSGALVISGAKVGDFSSGDLGQLEAKGSRQITVPLTVHFREAASAAAAIQRGAAEIGFSGEVSSGGVSIPFHATQVVRVHR